MKQLISISLLLLMAAIVWADAMPDFRLQDMNGKNVTLESLLDKDDNDHINGSSGGKQHGHHTEYFCNFPLPADIFNPLNDFLPDAFVGAQDFLCTGNEPVFTRKRFI